MHRSYAIREVETDLHEARARAMMKQPMYAGKTYQEVKAERRRYQMQLYKALTIGFAVLLLVAVAMYAGAQR